MAFVPSTAALATDVEYASLLAGRGYRLRESRALASRLADPSLEWDADHELLAVGLGDSATEDVIRARVW